MKAANFENYQEFIDIFKQDSYEKATLIWNREMRNILKQMIVSNSENIVHLLITSSRNKKVLGDEYQVEIPRYQGAISNVIKQKFIQEEVRCGQYYLRVWTQKMHESPNQRIIPREEEERFITDLKNLMNQTILDIKNTQDEEQLNHLYNKLHIMLKANLKALRQFQNMKNFGLDQIRDISMGTDIENMKLINKQKGMEIIFRIMRSVLLQAQIQNEEQNNIVAAFEEKQGAQNFTEESDNSFDLPMIYEERQNLKSSTTNLPNLESKLQNNSGIVIEQRKIHNLSIDKLDAKILLYCLQCMDKLLKLDIKSFVQLDQIFKIGLFKQLSQILDIGYKIYLGFSVQKKIQTEKLSKFMKDQTLQPNLLDQSNFMATSFNQKFGAHFQGTLKPLRYVEPTPINSSVKQITFNNLTSENKNQTLMGDHSYSRSNFIRSATKVPENQAKLRNLQIDFTGDYQKKKDRDLTLELVFSLISSTTNFIYTVSLNPILHPEIIISGLAWKSLQQCYFALWQDEKKHLVDNLLKDSIKTMQNLASFAYVFTHELQTNKSTFEQTNQFYQEIMAKYQDPKLKDIIIEFWFCMKKLLERKILNNLVLQFTLDNYDQRINLGRGQDFEVSKFIKIFSIEEKSHELIWNDQSRDELLNVIDEQMGYIDDSFFNKITEFDYQVNLNELRIESIFIKQFNSDIYYKPSDPNLFVKSLLDNLRKRVEKSSLPDLSEQQYDDVLEITKALRNLIQYQKVLETKAINHFLENISLLCQILKFKDSDSQNEQRIAMAASIIFDILKIISKNEKFTEALIHNIDFVRMVFLQLYNQESHQLLDIEDIIKLIQIINNLIVIDDDESDIFLIKYGLSIFLINTMLETQVDKRIRIEAVKVLRYKQEELSQIIASLMPIHFFTQMENQRNDQRQIILENKEEDLISIFLDHLDANSYENIFLRWNSDLRDQQSQKVKIECERILKEIFELENDFRQYQARIPTEQYQNPLCNHEIQISEVICRIFNKNSGLPIANEMDSFLTKLCIKLDKQLFCLQQIIDIFVNNEQDFHGNNDDFIVQIRQEVFTLKTVKKKFKFHTQQTLQVLTSLLLLIEQISQNNYNPNKRRNKHSQSGIEIGSIQSRSQVSYGGDLSKRDSNNYGGLQSQNQQAQYLLKPQQQLNNARTSTYLLSTTQQQLQNELNMLLYDDMMQIPLQFLKFMEDWLLLPIFHSSIVPIELRITFMQLIIITMEIPNAVEDLSEGLLEFSSKLLQQIVEEVDKKNIEDMIKITVVERMLMRGGREQILKFYNYGDNLNNIKRIFFMSKKLVGVMSQMEIFKHIFTFIQLNVDSESFNWKDLSVLPPRIDLSHEFQQQEFIKLWRPRPTSSADAKKFYVFSQSEGTSATTSIMEDKLEETQSVLKLKNLPYISIKAVKEIKKDSKKGKEELPIYNFIDNLKLLEEKEEFWKENKPVEFNGI